MRSHVSSATSGTSDWRKRVARLRIEAQGEIRQCHLAGVILQHLRVVNGREGVQIGNEVKRLLVILQVDVLTDGAEIVAPMRHTGWLDS